ncbi:hypothetical protein ABII15_30625 [Streptomyces sp. HUAS MG91]|uniref:Uncharacterized protein n=1 Tax=Streptomyces tabacisoli TaxID=3156398 RepID=A0AAU8J0N2_9ACTN
MDTPSAARDERFMLLDAFSLPSPLHGSDCMWCGLTRESGQAAAGSPQEPETGAAPGPHGAP